MSYGMMKFGELGEINNNALEQWSTYIYEKVPKVSKIHFCEYLLPHFGFYFL